VANNGYTLLEKDLRAIAKTVRRVNAIPTSLIGPTNFPNIASSPVGDSYVTVVNEGTEKLECFSVVKLDRTVSKNNQGGTAFPFRNHIWVATIPDATTNIAYGVLQAPVLPKGVGLTLVSGVTKVHLDDSSEGHYAAPVSGDAKKMQTGSMGSPVLSVDDPGKADTWGYVLLGGAAPSTMKWFRITAALGTAAPYLYSVVEINFGTWTDTAGGLTLVGGLKSIPESTMLGYPGHLETGRRVQANLGLDGVWWTESYAYNGTYGWENVNG
jgi:hypothetical protein